MREHDTIQARADLLNSLEGLTDEQANRIVQPGKWTIMQVLIHLHLMEDMIVKKLAAALEKEENNPTEPKPIHVTLDRSRRIESPGYLKPDAEFRAMRDIREKLDDSRAALLGAIDGVSDHTLTQKSFPHPVFGLMDAAQWVSFIGVHERRHTAQIEELKTGL